MGKDRGKTTRLLLVQEWAGNENRSLLKISRLPDTEGLPCLDQ